MTSLSTHVLDLTHGRPAPDVVVRLFYAGMLLTEARTSADGRCANLLGGRALARGEYRLEFEVAAYFRAQGMTLAEPPFLGTIGIDFGVADASVHHHVPLLVSPFGYSTYRGS